MSHENKPPTPPTRSLGYGFPYRGPGAKKEQQRSRDFKHPQRNAPLPYAELRAASAFSFLDGASLPEDLIARAAELGLPAMALIDTNGVYGAPRFYSAAKKAGVRALVGAELKMDFSILHSPFFSLHSSGHRKRNEE